MFSVQKRSGKGTDITGWDWTQRWNCVYRDVARYGSINVISAFRRLKQEDCKFRAGQCSVSLG